MSEAKQKTKGQILVEDYVKSKLALDDLTATVNAKKQAVIDELLSREDHTAIVDDGKVYLRKTVKYKYSKSVALQEETIKVEQESLKVLKRQEEETGVAKEDGEPTYTPVVKL